MATRTDDVVNQLRTMARQASAVSLTLLDWARGLEIENLKAQAGIALPRCNATLKAMRVVAGRSKLNPFAKFAVEESLRLIDPAEIEALTKRRERNDQIEQQSDIVWLFGQLEDKTAKRALLTKLQQHLTREDAWTKKEVKHAFPCLENSTYKEQIEFVKMQAQQTATQEGTEPPTSSNVIAFQPLR